MAQFSCSVNPTIAASTTTLPHFLFTNLNVGQIGYVKMVEWGGSDTSLIASQVVFARVTNTPITIAALTLTSTSPVAATPGATVGTYTTVGTHVAGVSLFWQAWNQQGGGGVVVLPIGGEWMIAGGALGVVGAAIGCGAVTGSGANCTFGLQFAE